MCHDRRRSYKHCADRNRQGLVFTRADNAQEEENPPLGVPSHTSLEEIPAFVNAAPDAVSALFLDAYVLNGALSQEGLRPLGL